jgi:hypothetical protein
MSVAVGSCQLPAAEKKAASSFGVQLLANDDGVVQYTDSVQLCTLPYSFERWLPK